MDINNFIQQFITLAPPILLALTCHEYAHGYVAWILGDPTAKNAGRLTMNPLKHLDPIGTIAIFIIKFGWAKPVPVNPAYFKHPKQDMLWVALAGPVANLFLAIITAILLKVLAQVYGSFPVNSAINTMIISPLLIMLVYSLIINILLCCFNLLPIPPLDGSKILTGLLPDDLARAYMSVERYGFIILLFMMFTNTLSLLISPVHGFAENLARSLLR